MAWFLMLLAIGCLLVMFVTKSFALGVLCMVLALVFLVAATMMLLSARITGAARKADILSADELRHLREQAQAKHVASTQGGTMDGTAATTSGTPPESPPPNSG